MAEQPRQKWQEERGGRIDPMKSPQGSPISDDARIDEYIAESFPASDPPSWNSGLDESLPEEDKHGGA